MADQDHNDTLTDTDDAATATDVAASTEASEDAKERPEQTVTIEDIGPARKKITIELPESRIKSKIEEAYKTLRSDAAVPGFRRGRAPRRLMERRFGQSVRDDVKGQLISESYSQAIEDEDLDVIGEPDAKDVKDLKLPESGPMTFTLDVEVAPEVTLPAYDTLEVSRPSAEVTQADIEREIEQYGERLGKMAEIEDATIEAHDFVKCDVRILAGENAAEDAEQLAHHPSQYASVHGEEHEFKGHVAGILIDDLGKRLLGKKVGHEETISMTGPQGHEDERIKNQPITIKLKVESVERLEPAPIEQIVERLGLESADKLREELKPVLEQRAQQRQQSQMNQQVTDQLLEKVELELPEGLTGRQTERVLRREAMQMAYRGSTQEEIEERLAQMRAESEDQARRQLKLFFILNEAAEQLKIEVGEAEINGQVTAMAMQQGRRPEKLRQEMQQRGEIENLYLQIREHKTLERIIEQAKVTDAPADAGK